MNDTFFQRNSIGLLRLVFALMVVVTHARMVLGLPPEQSFDPLERTGWQVAPGFPQSLATWGVLGFFFFSGLLITRSWAGRTSTLGFLWHRFLRIFPAYWICLLLTAGVLGALVWHGEHGALAGYFERGADSPFAYVRHAWFLDASQQRIWDLFAAHPHGAWFNGSLWTLRTEFGCYVAVAVAGVCLRPRAAEIVLGTLLFSFLILALSGQIGGSTWLGDWFAAIQPATFVPYKPARYWIVFFLLGVAAYRWRRHIPLSSRWAIMAAVALGLSAPTRWSGLVAPLAYGYLLLWLAAVLPGKDWGHRLDLSYGTYLYGYPIAQLLIWAHIDDRFGRAAYLGLAIAAPVLLAVASWTLVERPALRLKFLRSGVCPGAAAGNVGGGRARRSNFSAGIPH